jgi:hypothetical protein
LRGAAWYGITNFSENREEIGIVKKANDYVREMQKEMYKYSGIFLVLYLGLNVYPLLQAEGKIAAGDVFLANLAGYSRENFDFVEFIRYALFFMIPIFFAGMILEKENKMCSEHVAIRYGSRMAWKHLVRKNIGIYIFAYILIWGIGLVLLAVAAHFAGEKEAVYCMDFMEYAGISKQTLVRFFGLSILLKMLELCYDWEIFCLLYAITKNPVAAYIITFAGFIFGFLIRKSAVISFGCSAIYNLIDSAGEAGMMFAMYGVPFILIVKIAVVRLIYFCKRKELR